MATEFDAVVWEVARAAHMDRMLERKDPSFTRERAKAVLKDTINNKYGNPWKEVALEYRPTETLIRFSKHRLVGLRLLRGLLQTEPTKGHVAAVDTLSAAMFKQAQTDFPDEHVWRKEQPLPSFQELIDAFRQKLAALGEDMSVAPRKRTRDLDHAGSDGGEIQTGYAHASADLQHTFAMGLQQQQQLFHALDPQFHVDHADADADSLLAPEFTPVAAVLGLDRIARGRPSAEVVARDVLMTVTGAATAAEAEARAPPRLAAAIAAVAARIHRFIPVWPVLAPQAYILARH